MKRKTYLRDDFEPSLEDRKKAIYASKEFIASVDLTLHSASRLSGTVAAWTTTLPTAVRGVWGASLKYLCLPMNFGNIMSVKTFTVTYNNVVTYPTSLTLAAGSYYWYSIDQGTVTYATANAQPNPNNNLVYAILQNFQNGIDSITVNPNTGAMTWTWDASTGGVTSSNLPSFFQFGAVSGTSWVATAPIDLVGVKDIGVIIPDLASQNSKSNVVTVPNYLATVPVNVQFGSELVWEPIREDICWLGAPKTISLLSVMLVDTATNNILPLVSNWNICVRLYVSQEQTS